ncbi:ATP-binding protein [Deinococcus aerophilus]|nr:ATP-binding protein [Deinococcus aerophilus]
MTHISPPEQNSDAAAQRLLTLALQVSAASTRSSVGETLLSGALDLTGAAAGAVFLLDESAGGLETVAFQEQEAGLGGPACLATLRAAVEAWPPEVQSSGTAGPCTVVPLSMAGQLLGALVLDLGAAQAQDAPADRALPAALHLLAAHGALALDRVRVADELRVRTKRTRELEERRAALDAFVAFTEVSAGTSQGLELATHAVDVLRATLGDLSVAYYERTDGLWKARVWSDDLTPEVVASITAGVAPEAPSFARAVDSRDVLFIPGWDAGYEEVAQTESYGAVALYPCFVAEEARGMLAMGIQRAGEWSEREQAVFRAVGSSLRLALERAEDARQLQVQNAELAARTRVLEAFADLTRRLTLHGDPYALIHRAQDVVRSLLPDGAATYYEPEGPLWRVKSQSGDLRHAELQAALDAGLPLDSAQNLNVPYTSHQPYYQDVYDLDTDQLHEHVRHIGATATLPVTVRGEVRGVFAVALFGRRRWSETDRAMLDTVVYSLGLALEGAQALRELDRTQHYLKVVAENAPLLLFATDAQGVFTLSEGRLLTRLGLQPEQAVGQCATTLFQHEPDLRAGTWLAGALAGESTHGLMQVESSGITLETWFVPLRDEKGQVSEVVGVSLDVTERLEAQRQVERANEELRRSNHELEQFAYVASHDLQEPLRTVTSFSQLLARKHGGQLDEKSELYLRMIGEGSARMSRLLQDLLAFSRVTTGARTSVRVDTADVLAQVVQDLHGQIEQTSADLQVFPLPTVQGDPTQVRQIFQNLIGNALKFSVPERAPRITVTACRMGREVQFSVQDNGIGIAPEFFERIFTIFQRLHTRDQYEGNGIGLSITHRIIERHRGRLWLESTPGQGSTFFFTLPADG